MIVITAKAPGLRDLRGRFATWDKELARIRNREVRAFLPRFLVKLKAFSPEGETKVFKESWVGKVRSRGVGGTGVYIWNKDPKAPFVIRPTKPHKITARRARFLKLPTGFRKSVMHPGTKGSDVMVRAYQQGGADFTRVMNRAGIKSLHWLEIHR